MDIIKSFIDQYEGWSGNKPLNIAELPQSGSDRRYFRINGPSGTTIGVFNPDPFENEAFVYLARHFISIGLNVPLIYSRSIESNTYLIQDLGDTTLFDLIKDHNNGMFTAELINYYHIALQSLLQFQINGFHGLDTARCYPVTVFGSQSIQWDLNYFKYYFLKPSGINFNERLLESSFNDLITKLLETDNRFFMYRDFQARNIMVKEGRLYFIDFQGGRQGPLPYDVVSLLYQAKANIPENLREELLNEYCQGLLKATNNKTLDNFRKNFGYFVLIRLLQVLGAYGYRGFFENKPHFLTSVPFAVKIVSNIIPQLKEGNTSVYLLDILEDVSLLKFPVPISRNENLNIAISSFSYKKKIPPDYSGNGGGFVFDCRALPNPGRFEQFRDLTGLNDETARFLSEHKEVQHFLEQVFKLLEQSIDNYQKRKFTHLTVAFGCTGGRHRSVYCAQQLYMHLSQKPGLNCTIDHTVIGKD